MFRVFLPGRVSLRPCVEAAHGRIELSTIRPQLCTRFSFRYSVLQNYVHNQQDFSRGSILRCKDYYEYSSTFLKRNALLLLVCNQMTFPIPDVSFLYAYRRLLHFPAIYAVQCPGLHLYKSSITNKF